MTEHDPTAIEPGDEDLPPKSPIEDMPTDEDVEAAGEPGEEEVTDEEFMHPDEAREDDTVDDEELDEP